MPSERLIRRHERPMGSTPTAQGPNSMSSGAQSYSMPSERMKPELAISQLRNDVRALNSAIAIISQKMKHLVRNEKILGRNLVVLNKKMQSGSMGSANSSSDLPGDLPAQLETLTVQLNQQSLQIQELRSLILDLKTTGASLEELQELKHVIDLVNPLEFVTRSDVKDLIQEGLGKKSKEKK